MIVINLTATESAATILPFTVNLNTNNGIIYDTTKSTISIVSPGIYEISGEITATSTTSGDYGVDIYINDSDSDNSSISSATAASETVTMPVYSVIEVATTSNSTYVTLTFVPTGTPTIVSGTLSVKKIS